MWIVLLDHSGSMGDPFSAGTVGEDRRTRRSERERKLDAAKESVLLELGRLPNDMPVALFGFTTRAVFILRGDAGARAEFASAIAPLEAGGGTDVASALRSTVEYVTGLPGRPLTTRVLVVTDGLSDPLPAKEAALACRDAGIVVDVILIDPTNRGTSLARSVTGLTFGRWDSVSGRDELAAATSRSRTATAAQAERAQALLDKVLNEAEELVQATADREPVEFTAAYPGLMEPSATSRLYVYAHLPSMRDELETRLRNVSADLGRHPGRASGLSNTMIEPGRVLEFHVVFSDIRCIPDRQDLVWRQQLEELQFELEYAGTKTEGTTCRGQVDVCVDGMLIAQIPLSIVIAPEAGGTSTAAQQRSSAPMLRRVFVSYAHEDEEFVRRCKAAYRALGINLFVDRDDIESGQLWRNVVTEMIAKHDLFQLYWSRASSASPQVAEEWQFALTVAGTKSASGEFVRPLYWRRPMPTAPPALKALHFRYVDPQSLGLHSIAATQAPSGRPHASTRPV